MTIPSPLNYYRSPPLFAIRSRYAPLPSIFDNIPRRPPFQEKRRKTSSVILSAPRARPILQSPALLKCATPYEDLLPALPTLRSHGSQSGGRVGSKYHEPSVPHIYQEASVVHRFHRMLLSLGKDRVSVQLCFGCFAMGSTLFPFPVHSLCISDTQGRTRWEGSSPSLCPADHSAGISHSRPRLTAAR